MPSVGTGATGPIKAAFTTMWNSIRNMGGAAKEFTVGAGNATKESFKAADAYVKSKDGVTKAAKALYADHAVSTLAVGTAATAAAGYGVYKAGKAVFGRHSDRLLSDREQNYEHKR